MTTTAAKSPASAVGAWRAAWLLTHLRLRRQWNIVRSAYRFRKSSKRAATASSRRASLGWLLTAFVVLSMIGNCVNMSNQSMIHMQKTLGTAEVYKAVKRGWLGVQLGAVTADNAERLGIDPPHGALITGLFAGGTAQSAGLRVNDTIVAIGGKTIGTISDMQRTIAATPTGNSVNLVIVRDGKEMRATVEVGVNPEDTKPVVQHIPAEPGTVLAPLVLRGVAFEAALLLLAALFLTLASREIAKPEWDLEWLATLPLPLSTLLSCRLFERSVTNPAGLVLFGPFLSVVAWYCGYRWTAPLIGLGLAFVLSFVVATCQTLVDTGLRLVWPPSRLRNLQALVSVVGTLPLAFALATALHDDSFVFGWVAALPHWLSYLPAGLAIRALAAVDGVSAALWFGAMLAEVIVFAAIAFAILHRQLRNGVLAAGAREAGVRVRRPPREQMAGWQVLGGMLSPIQRREIRLLGRDRAFLAQTLLLPLVMVGTQILVYATSNIFVGAVDHPENLAAIAFGLAGYTLMASAFQTLNAEGQALWILYSVPSSLETILRQKAKLWASVATIYPIVIFAIAAGMAGGVSMHFVTVAAIVVLGVPIFTAIATALGVFACNPLAQEVQRRVRPTFLYLYLLLSSLYVYAIYANKIWQQGAMIILSALLAIALWQKARDRLDYLLEPTASPPARVSVSDGLIAALMFFVLQALVQTLLHFGDLGLSVGTTLWISFCVAGAVTYCSMRLVYRVTHTGGVPRLFGPDLPRALLFGVAGGIVASVAGLIYILLLAHFDLLPSMRQSALAADRDTAIWLPTLAIAAAPFFEEFIFRGLIFGGLRRSLGLGAATCASAAIFAIVHPPLSIIPVFFVGICTAVIYEHTKMLAAPMLVHAVYNAVVIGFQWNVMQ